MLLNLVKKAGAGIAMICLFQIILGGSVFASEYTTLPGGSGSVIKMIEPGQEAADFVIKTLEDDDYKLSSIIGKKVVFLLFWSIFCQPCQEEIPVIKELYDKIGKDNLIVIAVSLDGDKRVPAIEKYVEKNKLDFLFLMDVFDEETNQYIASDKYGVLGTPTFFIIDKSGVVTHNHTGKTTLDDLLKKVSDAQPGS